LIAIRAHLAVLRTWSARTACVSARQPPASAVGGRSGGFALLIVLWTLVLVAFIVAHVTASGRTEVRIAGNLVANAVAGAAADGAIFAAIFNLMDPKTDQHWAMDRTARELTIGGSRVMVRLEDEAGRINPNWASPALLQALLRVAGSDPESARRLAAAISEWAGSAPVLAPQNARLAEYRAAGLDYGPPDAPLENLDELARVLGMTPALLAAIRPHLSLFGPPEPSPATTDPVVAAALAQVALAGQAASSGNQMPPDVHTVRITALASDPGNGRVTRTAVVRFGAMLPRGYVVLAWGSDFD
jgi:general secretion pathway protein K